MNIYSLPALISMLVMPALGVFIFIQNKNSKVHKLFLILALFITYWAFIEYNLKQSHSFETARFWVRAGLFTPLITSFFVHFLLTYINKWDKLGRFKGALLVYLPALIISLFNGFTDEFRGVMMSKWGWSFSSPENPALYYLYIAWKSALLVYFSKEAIPYYKTSTIEEKKPLLLLFSSLIAITILSIFLTFARRVLHLNFPEMTLVVVLIYSLLVSYIIWKYNMFPALSDSYEKTINAMSDFFLFTDADNRILQINDTFLRTTGYTKNELVKTHISKLFDNAQEIEKPYWGKINLVQKKLNVITKAGKRIPVLLCKYVLFNKANVPTASVIIAKDLTYWYKSQQELLKLEKLSSLEMITCSIAHDFNNILNSATLNLSTAKHSQLLPEQLKDNIKAAEQAILVAAELTNRLSCYARDIQQNFTSCDINEVIKESAELAFRSTSIEFNYHADPNLWKVYAYRSQLIQIFINLFINAKQSMTDGGHVAVQCSNLTLNNTDYIKISVQDNGPGIPEEIIDQVFTPFFTTKIEGSGLGLSIVKNVVENYRGKIEIESKDRSGTTFHIYLPKSDISITCHHSVLSAQNQVSF